MRNDLISKGWEMDKFFPNDMSYFKDGRRINLDKDKMNIYAADKKFLGSIDIMKYLSGNDKVVEWFITV
ncbi:MAG: hypothetical protein KAH32_08960 [Chlamydiia bacterium]|nr:hypothetical protein [Chlamydiia bacterium]